MHVKCFVFLKMFLRNFTIISLFKECPPKLLNKISETSIFPMPHLTLQKLLSVQHT